MFQLTTILNLTTNCTNHTNFYINAKFNFFVKFVRFVVLKTSYWW